MRIAVDTRFLQAEDKPDFNNFTKAVFWDLAVEHSEHQFIFFADNELQPSPDLPKNVSLVILKPKPTHILLYKWWYDVKLSQALKRTDAHIFVASYGLASLATRIPQVLLVSDLAFLQKPTASTDSSRGFRRRYTSGFIKKSAAVITLSGYVNKALATHFKGYQQKVQSIAIGADAAFTPVDWETREAVKEQFSEGYEYFIYPHGFQSDGGFWNILKAFSIFKKWQKSNMKLVVTGSFESASAKDREKLKTYKHRQDVFMKEGLVPAERSQLLAASYAMIFLPADEIFPAVVLNAMQCEVPVITRRRGDLNEILEEAGLYVNSDSPEDVAGQMKLLFKDEQLRKRLIEAGKLRMEYFRWDKTRAALWKVIQENVSK
jgi:glycosyltransferase involved in cell wall biosynthesis